MPEKNTFKFQSFTERLSQVNIQVTRRIQNQQTSENFFFQDCQEKWTQLNLSDDYNVVKKEIGSVNSLSELVFKKDDIVNALVKALSNTESLALDAVLELVVALAKDLQEDFYENFPKIFNVLVGLLQSKNPELIEQSFCCLSYLFKALWRYMKRDINNVYDLYCPLLKESQKYYIRTFAAESISFLIRKINKREDLFRYIFSKVDEDSSLTIGSGDLIFESVRGVNTKFHSCHEEVFPMLLGVMIDESNYSNSEKKFLILKQAFCRMAKHCSKEYTQVIWSSFDNFSMEVGKVNVGAVHSHFVQLFSIWVQHNRGSLILQPENVIEILCRLLKSKFIGESVDEVFDVVAFLLKSNIILEMKDVTEVLHQVFKCSVSQTKIFQFTKTMFSYGMFQKDVLPLLLKYSINAVATGSDEAKAENLLIITELILHNMSSHDLNVQSIQSSLYPLQFNDSRIQKKTHCASKNIFLDYVHEIMKLNLISENLPLIYSAVVCLPHIRTSKKLQDASLQLINSLKASIFKGLFAFKRSEESHASKFSFIYLEVLKSILKMEGDLHCSNIMENEDMIMLLRSFPKDVNILRLVSFYFEIKKDFPANSFERIFEIIQTNLSSPYHLVRLLTLKIVTVFENHKLSPVLNHCLSAELLPVNMSEYREKRKFLQKLDFDSLDSQMPDCIFSKVSLQYLLGILFVNLQPLWDPILELISSHAVNFETKAFWEIFYCHLTETTKLAVSGTEHEEIISSEARSNCDNLFQEQQNMVAADWKSVDYKNHRKLLWKAMSMFVGVIEPHNRDIATMFLDFIHHELYPDDLTMAPSQNVLKDDGETREDSENKTKPKGSLKVLCFHLEVLSKFRNPRAVHRQEELEALYLQFLTHKNGNVQKCGLDCIMSYKHNYLTPYSENLYRLLDDKTFKSEITLFTIDSDNGVILKEHRSGTVPILMRIMFGKMLHKTGSNTSGKANAVTRRAIVLRYLAGTQHEELQIFLNLVFSHFKNLDSDTVKAVISVRQTIDLTKVIPLYRLQSYLNMLNVIFDQLGSHIDQHIPWLFKMLLIMIQTIGCLLFTHHQKVSDTCIRFLRTLRTNSMNRLIQFFEQYEHYPFTANEIDAVFEAVVSTQLPRLEADSVNNPAPLLRLFKTWSTMPKFFSLFSKAVDDNSSTVLVNITRLFASKNIQKNVVDLILLIIANLFTLEESEEDVLIPINHSIMSTTEKNESLNYGTHLLLPHLPNILKRMRVIVMHSAKNPRRKLTSRDLTVLSRASEHVVTAKESAELVSLLLMCLKKCSSKSEDVQTNSLKTIKNLLHQVEDPSTFLLPLSALFTAIQHRMARAELCACFEVISKNVQDIEELKNVLFMINAWDLRKVDEPDFLVRLNGFKTAREVFESKLESDYLLVHGLAIINNCCFFITNIEDMSLRDSSSFTLQCLAQHFSYFMTNNTPAFKSLVLENLVPEIRKNLRHKDENIRHEFISILSKIVESCSNHSKFKELAQLLDSDPEIDFFENIKHIQIHRRTRAMVRFAQSMKKGEMKFSAYTLSAFIMPIISIYLNGSYDKHNNLIDAVVLVIGVICRHLPWFRYESTFQFYMKMVTKGLDRQKTIIKVIVAVLDAFPFDLSKSCGIDKKALNEKEDENEDFENKGAKMDLDLTFANSIENPAAKRQNLEGVTVDLATKIHQTIASVIIPKLHKTLNQKAKVDAAHKTNKKIYPEDEEVLRIPIAVAMVKLLKNLPKGMLEQNIPGIFLRLCELLRSRSEAIRDTTRQTLVKIMMTLGPKFIWFMLREMRSTLLRGYQVHVMTFTIHSVLLKMAESKLLKIGDVDSCLKSIIDICSDELFGNVSEEKEVVQITRKWKEARGVKSYNLYLILSKYISSNLLPDLVIRLKDVLVTTHSHKVIRKVTECLHQIVLGLPENIGIDIKSLMIFIHGICHESIPKLNDLPKKPVDISTDERLQPQSTYIIPEEPKRMKIKNKTAKSRANTHILVEFGLQLLNACLKRDLVNKKTQEHLEMLDPFVSELTDCLSSQHVKTISAALRCLTILIKFPLPSFEKHIDKIRNSIFLILKKYAGPGLAQGDNFEMVILCFKAMTALLRDTIYCSIDNEMLTVLTVYIEQDIHDHTRQATAFSLLKAILHRKYASDDIVELMKKIRELAITSELDHIRAQCRQVIIQYILDYPLGKELGRFMKFFSAQLSYECQPGRESVLEILNSIFTAFPESLVHQFSGIYFVSLSMALVNDESEKCRKMISIVIKLILKKINFKGRNNLFNMTLLWFKEDKHSMVRLSAQLCGLFAEVEEQFESRLPTLVPIIIKNTKNVSDDEDHDRILYHTTNLLLKIFAVCEIRNSKHHKSISEIFYNLQALILYPHTWVRLTVAQLYGLLFSTYSVDTVVNAVNSEAISADYLLADTKQKLRDLSADFCTVLQSPILDENLSEQVVKNLVYLGKVIHRVDLACSVESSKLSDVTVSFDWIIRRLLREVQQEVANNPKHTLRRSCVFKWIAAVSLDLGCEQLHGKLWLLLRPLVREMTDPSAHGDEKLKILAQEVLDIIKRVVGIENFTTKYTEVQSKLGEKRLKRKHDRATEVMNDPVKAADRKMKKQLLKVVAKKRKIKELKGAKPTKMRKIL